MSSLAPFTGLIRRALRLSRSEVREWFAWAEKNPHAAGYQLRAWSGFAEHRARVLKARKRVFRKKVRVARWLSIATELQELANFIEARHNAQ